MSFCAKHQHAFVNVCSECVVEQQQQECKKALDEFPTLHELRQGRKQRDEGCAPFTPFYPQGTYFPITWTEKGYIACPMEIHPSAWRTLDLSFCCGNGKRLYYTVTDHMPVMKIVDIVAKWAGSDYCRAKRVMESVLNALAMVKPGTTEGMGIA